MGSYILHHFIKTLFLSFNNRGVSIKFDCILLNHKLYRILSKRNKIGNVHNYVQYFLRAMHNFKHFTEVIPIFPEIECSIFLAR